MGKIDATQPGTRLAGDSAERRTFVTQIAGKAWCGVILIAAILAWLAPAQADNKSLLDALRQKGLLTQQEYERLKGTELTPAQRTGLIDILRDKGVLTKDEAAKVESAAPAAPAAPVAAPAEKPGITLPQVGYNEGFFLRAEDGNFVMRVNGRLSADFLFSEPNSSPNNTESVDRARLSVDANFYKYFRVRIENEFSSGAFSSSGNTSSSGLRDGFIAVTPMPEFNLQAGQYVIPVGYENIVSKRYIDFVERAAVVSSTFNPRRDVGVMVYGAFANKLVQYNLGAMNGVGQNHTDNNSDKDLVAHLVVVPFANEGPEHLRGFNIGSGVTWGHQPSDTVTTSKTNPSGFAATASSITGQTETLFNFFPAVARHGDRLRWASHVAWLDGPFSVVSEYLQTEEACDGLGDNGADLPRLYTDGAYVDGTWLITGERKPYNARIHPKRPLWDLKNPGLGAWEAALRYEYYKLRDHAARFTNGTIAEADNRYDAIVAGINWYPNEFLRFSVNYIYGNFAHQGANKSPNPDKHSNNLVLCRAQVEF
jgi:phosphate-selective porin